ncbi:cupin domain-containing protein [Amycolatopsis sacchari]
MDTTRRSGRWATAWLNFWTHGRHETTAAEVVPLLPGPRRHQGAVSPLGAGVLGTGATRRPHQLAAEAEERLPGLMGVFEPDSPGMHTTDTVDYGICLEGELHLELDNGKEVKLTPGACVVQQGTRHAWHNRSDKPALMCYVLVGAERTS